MHITIRHLGYCRRIPYFLSAILLLWSGAGLGGCESPSLQVDSNQIPNVVSTSTIITDWTTNIGGDTIQVVGILEPGADPHIYEPVPADSAAMEDADLILYNGYNLEPNLVRIITATGVNARKVAVGEIVTPLDFDYEGQSVPDPHVWGNVKNVIQMVELIRDELIQLRPDEVADLTANAATLIAELEQLDHWIATQIATIPPDQRQLVTTHDAFQYYTHAYGLEVAGTLIGISTEEQPSAQTVQRLADTIRELGVPTIFAETTINPRLIRTVATEAGVDLASTELYSDSIGAPESRANTYINMMVVNTQTIVENLGGQYRPFDGVDEP